jgi:hypothetical protein
MLGSLESANRSSRERWKFVSSGRFLALIVGYFPVVLLLNRCYGLPDDLYLLAVQLVGITVLFVLAFCSTLAIPTVLAASLKFYAAAFATIPTVVEQFTDFVPAVHTPPPKF